MKITEHEMRGLLAGKCVPGDMKVNEELPAYLVRKFAEQQQKLDELAAENETLKVLAKACNLEFEGDATFECKDDEKVSYPEDECHITFGMIRSALKTPATDAYLNSVRAELRILVESEIADFCAGLQSPGEPETPEEMQAELLERIATVFREAK